MMNVGKKISLVLMITILFATACRTASPKRSGDFPQGANYHNEPRIEIGGRAWDGTMDVSNNQYQIIEG